MLDFGLFRDRLFAYASAARFLNSLARGAVLFVLIFFLQGPYGLNPLSAGIMMAPFGAAFMLVGPVSGYLSDKYGSRGLATSGLLVSAIGLLGLATVVGATPYWQIGVSVGRSEKTKIAMLGYSRSVRHLTQSADTSSWAKSVAS